MPALSPCSSAGSRSVYAISERSEQVATLCTQTQRHAEYARRLRRITPPQMDDDLWPVYTIKEQSPWPWMKGVVSGIGRILLFLDFPSSLKGQMSTFAIGRFWGLSTRVAYGERNLQHGHSGSLERESSRHIICLQLTETNNYADAQQKIEVKKSKPFKHERSSRI
jgi:hypothetical protein